MEYLLIFAAFWLGLGFSIALVRLHVKPISKRLEKLPVDTDANAAAFAAQPRWAQTLIVALMITIAWPVELLKRGNSKGD